MGCTRIAGSDYPMDTKFMTVSENWSIPTGNWKGKFEGGRQEGKGNALSEKRELRKSLTESLAIVYSLLFNPETTLFQGNSVFAIFPLCISVAKFFKVIIFESC